MATPKDIWKINISAKTASQYISLAKLESEQWDKTSKPSHNQYYGVDCYIYYSQLSITIATLPHYTLKNFSLF
jgi:hypothetical protein